MTSPLETLAICRAICRQIGGRSGENRQKPLFLHSERSDLNGRPLPPQSTARFETHVFSMCCVPFRSLTVRAAFAQKVANCRHGKRQ